VVAAQTLSEIALVVSGCAAVGTITSAIFARKNYYESRPDLSLSLHFKLDADLRREGRTDSLSLEIMNKSNGPIELTEFGLVFPEYKGLGWILLRDKYTEGFDLPFVMPGRSTRRWSYQFSEILVPERWDPSASRQPVTTWSPSLAEGEEVTGELRSYLACFKGAKMLVKLGDGRTVKLRKRLREWELDILALIFEAAGKKRRRPMLARPERPPSLNLS
jgi:hypothetical protein